VRRAHVAVPVKEMAIYPDFGHEALPEMSDRIFALMLAM
jgi:hypothetical protein